MVTWENTKRSEDSGADPVVPSNGGGRGGETGSFMKAFGSGQGQMPYQVRRRAREQAQEAQRQAYQEERSNLLHVLKKAVQGFLVLAMGKSEDDCSSTSFADGAAMERDALNQIVTAVYESLRHGIKSLSTTAKSKEKPPPSQDPSTSAQAVWALLQRVAKTTPGCHLVLAFLINIPATTAEGRSRAFIRLCICEKSIGDVLDHLVRGDSSELEAVYEDWALLRDLESSTLHVALVASLANLHVAFDWLLDEDSVCAHSRSPTPSTNTNPPSTNAPDPNASSRARSALKSAARSRSGTPARCGPPGAGLMAIPENIEHLEEDEEWVEVRDGVAGRKEASRPGAHSEGATAAAAPALRASCSLAPSTAAAMRGGYAASGSLRKGGRSRVKKTREISICDGGRRAADGSGGDLDEAARGGDDASCRPLDVDKLIENITERMEEGGVSSAGNKNKKRSTSTGKTPSGVARAGPPHASSAGAAPAALTPHQGQAAECRAGAKGSTAFAGEAGGVLAGPRRHCPAAAAAAGGGGDDEDDGGDDAANGGDDAPKNAANGVDAANGGAVEFELRESDSRAAFLPPSASSKA